MTELACRLLSLRLRRGTPIDEIIEQCRGIKDMAPTPNVQVLMQLVRGKEGRDAHDLR